MLHRQLENNEHFAKHIPDKNITARDTTFLNEPQRYQIQIKFMPYTSLEFEKAIYK